MVTHPKISIPQNAKESLAAARNGVKLKKRRYCDNFMVDEADIKPIVFETMGGTAEESFNFLREVVKVISADDEHLFAQLWRTLRSRIAVALAVGHADVIHCLNSKQRHRMGVLAYENSMIAMSHQTGGL